MGGVVKKVAPIAIGVGLGYATAGTSTAAWGSYGGLGSIGTVGVGGGLSMGTVLSAGSLLTQGYSTIQSQKYASQQAGFQRQQVEAKNAADAQRNRFNQIQNKRQRLAAIRQARIQQAAISGSMGNVLGQGGTSGYVGALGSLGSQASGNIGNVNVAEGYGNEISRLNTMSANYGSQANTAASKSGMWSDITVLGGNLMTQAPQILNIFGTK